MVKIVSLFVSLSVCSLAFAQTQWNQAQQEVVDAIEGYLAAWNSFDAEKLALFCDEDCDRIDARGNIYHGREEILRHYTKVFATPPPERVERKLTYDIFSVRIVAPGVAVVDARYTLQSPPPRPLLTIKGMNTVVLVKKEGRWLRVAHRQRVPRALPDDGKQN